MRTAVAMAAVALLAAGSLAPNTSSAQGTPSTNQIVKSLTPTSTSGATRGIRVAPTGTGGAPAAETPAVSLTVQFATGSAELTPQATHVLDNLGKALNTPSLANYRFRIEGHTDTVGSPEYNRALSERRAETVVDYIAKKYGVEPSRMQAVGMGEAGLLVQTPPQTAEPRNRRVEVINLGA